MVHRTDLQDLFLLTILKSSPSTGTILDSFSLAFILVFVRECGNELSPPMHHNNIPVLKPFKIVREFDTAVVIGSYGKITEDDAIDVLLILEEIEKTLI